MPVIPVNRVEDKKRIIGKMEGQGGGEAQGVADPKNAQASFYNMSALTRWGEHTILGEHTLLFRRTEGQTGSLAVELKVHYSIRQ
jgi:hypothetical protein